MNLSIATREANPKTNVAGRRRAKNRKKKEGRRCSEGDNSGRHHRRTVEKAKSTHSRSKRCAAHQRTFMRNQSRSVRNINGWIHQDQTVRVKNSEVRYQQTSVPQVELHQMIRLGGCSTNKITRPTLQESMLWP